MNNEQSEIEVLIQCEAQDLLDRGLTAEELEVIHKKVCEELLSWVIQESIEAVLDYNDMLERNKDAEHILPHYKVSHKNNDFRPEYKERGYFKNMEDVETFIYNNTYSALDKWEIILVDAGGNKQEILRHDYHKSA